jgi:hypothetical protein
MPTSGEVTKALAAKSEAAWHSVHPIPDGYVGAMVVRVCAFFRQFSVPERFPYNEPSPHPPTSKYPTRGVYPQRVEGLGGAHLHCGVRSAAQVSRTHTVGRISQANSEALHPHGNKTHATYRY